MSLPQKSKRDGRSYHGTSLTFAADKTLVISWNCGKNKESLNEINRLIITHTRGYFSSNSDLNSTPSGSIHSSLKLSHQQNFNSHLFFTTFIILLQEAPPYFENTLSRSNWLVFTEKCPHADYRSAIAIYPASTKATLINCTKTLVTARLFLTHSELIISSVYIPPDIPVESTLDQLNSIEEVNTGVILGGDWNARSNLWGDRLENARGKKIRSWLEKKDYVICSKTDTPTFSAVIGEGTRESNVDFILTSRTLSANLMELSHLIDLHLSDHRPLALSFEGTMKLLKPVPTTRIYRKDQAPESYADFSIELDRQLEAMPLNSTLNDLVDDFERRVHIAAAGNLRKVSTGKHRMNLPWWDEEIESTVKAIKKVKKYLKKGSLTSQVKKAVLIEKLKKNLKKDIDRKKKQFFRQQFSIEDPQQVWDKFYKRLTRASPDNDIYLIEDGSRITDQAIILGKLAKKFFSHDNRDEDSEIHREIREESVIPKAFQVNTDPGIPTLEEVKMAIDSFSAGKMPGQDGITNEIMASFTHNSIQKFNHIVKLIWTQRKFPTAWKKATIKFLRKPGAKKGTIKQFRPIGLLSCPSKVIERIIHSRVDWYRVKNIRKDMRMKQYGFTPKVSSEDAVFDLISWITGKHKTGKKSHYGFSRYRSGFR